LKFTQKANLNFTENSSQSFILNPFNGSYTGGNWQLETKVVLNSNGQDGRDAL